MSRILESRVCNNEAEYLIKDPNGSLVWVDSSSFQNYGEIKQFWRSINNEEKIKLKNSTFSQYIFSKPSKFVSIMIIERRKYVQAIFPGFPVPVFIPFNVARSLFPSMLTAFIENYISDPKVTHINNFSFDIGYYRTNYGKLNEEAFQGSKKIEASLDRKDDEI